MYVGIPKQVRNDCYYLVLVTLNSFQGLYNIFIGIPRLRYKKNYNTLWMTHPDCHSEGV